MADHRSREELDQGLEEIAKAPKDGGRLEAIVIRPRANERRPVNSVEISADLGVNGDHWAKGCWKTLPDGNPHPDVQICIMNARVIRLLAGDKDNWPPAGDQLFFDLDLSRDNLEPGQRLKLGGAVIEITDVPHNGCRKFIERYGLAATQFVNSKFGKENRFRGVYAKVVETGTISVGDMIQKV